MDGAGDWAGGVEPAGVGDEWPQGFKGGEDFRSGEELELLMISISRAAGQIVTSSSKSLGTERDLFHARSRASGRAFGRWSVEIEAGTR